MTESLELKIPPPLWLALYAGLMKVAAVAFPQAHLSLPFAAGLCPILVGLGLSLAAAGIVAVRSAGTTLNPRRPEATRCVVDQGVYGVTRNPMYLGLLLLLLGWGVHLQNAASLLVIAPWMATITRWQIQPEERILEERFGETYLDYRRRVPRWLFRWSQEDLTL